MQGVAHRRHRQQLTAGIDVAVVVAMRLAGMSGRMIPSHSGWRPMASVGRLLAACRSHQAGLGGVAGSRMACSSAIRSAPICAGSDASFGCARRLVRPSW